MKRLPVLLAYFWACCTFAQTSPTLLYEGEKCALADSKTLKLLTPCKYQYIDHFYEGWAVATLQDAKGKSLYTFVNEQGKELFEPAPNQIFRFVNGFAIFREKDKFGFLDKLGRVIVPAQYYETHNFSEGLAKVIAPEGKIFYLNTAGEEVIAIDSKQYQFTDNQCLEGLIRVCKQNQKDIFSYNHHTREDDSRRGDYRFLDKTGKEVLNIQTLFPDKIVKYASRFEQGFATVGIVQDTTSNYPSLLLGVINKAGKVVLPFEYQAIERRGNHWLVTREVANQYTGLFTLAGKEVIPCAYHGIKPLTKSRYILEKRDGFIFEEPQPDIAGMSRRISSVLGLADSTGKILMPPQFSTLWLTKQGEILARKNNTQQYGLYDSVGKRVDTLKMLHVQDTYIDEMHETNYKCEIVVAKLQGKVALLNLPTHTFETDWVDEFAPFIILRALPEMAYRKGKTWHLLNQTFEYACTFGEGMFAPVRKGNRWGLLHQSGNMTVPFQYDSIVPNLLGKKALISKYSDYKLEEEPKEKVKISMDIIQTLPLPAHCFLACQNKRWGVINGFGKVLVPFENEAITDVFYDYLLAKRAGKIGALDYAGKEKVPFHYNSIRAVNGFFYAYQNKTTRLYDSEGKAILPDSYDNISTLTQGFFLLEKDGKKGVANEVGKILLSLVHDTIYINSTQEYKRYHRKDAPTFFLFQQAGKWGAINDQGEAILACEFEEIILQHDWETQPFLVQKGAKKGLFSRQGKPILPVVYTNIEFFLECKIGEEMLYWVSQGDKKGIANARDELVLPPIFQHLKCLNDTLLAFSEKDYHVFDRAGKQIFTIPLADITIEGLHAFHEKALVIAKRKDKWGYISFAGKLLVPFAYSEVTPFVMFQNGRKYARVRKGKHWGVIDEAGKAIVPIEYQSIKSLVMYQKTTEIKGVIRNTDVFIEPKE